MSETCHYCEGEIGASQSLTDGETYIHDDAAKCRAVLLQALARAEREREEAREHITRLSHDATVQNVLKLEMAEAIARTERDDLRRWQ